MYPYRKVNDPMQHDVAANGQWLLISRGVYESIGGHRAIRQEILEDVALARRVKRSGNRIHFAPARGLARTRMYQSFAEMWEGWSKNLYLLFSPWRGGASLTIITPLLIWIPLAYGLIESPEGVAAGLVGGHLAAAGYFLWRKWSLVNALFLFPGLHLLSALMLSSWFRHRWRRKVTWKGRSYTVTSTGPSAGTSETRQTK